MPELPEVETVRRGLEPAMAGEVIARAEIRRPDLRWPFPEGMAERLAGARIDTLGRRSKYLLLHLDRGETLIVHLGMSGRMVVEETQLGRFRRETSRLERHDHVVLHMASGTRVVFNDPRRFGAMDLIATERLAEHWLLSRLGPEPLGNAFDEDHLVAAFRGRMTPVKSALLDQRIVAGLGNIYVCEALHRARIAPARKAGRIAAHRVRALVPVIRATLDEAIAAGGSSLRDYRQADGALGYFQHGFRVYDREGVPCVTEGCDGIVQRFTQSGRSTFHCPRCQR
ncbi:bifunctional DNA-formamidopyrimidine glycosylase/DNA-(apurinic or apyrimidinic site) lyase [Palleronia sp. LCG004]|uniref:bifunctional DNA-formamidopyrimidine glycosylase/DNA-(apurinic or apyrimidinic site) lyase n=1 Tax=Palleronia sp. LCG004 TaxID=3079304 RepID=UPI002943A8FF|nr:bifunctional DNA-formamidopyrimidine glycosylase/DNA-(apurinic or apyrimidinic site) lyase [Palleronia sp. LCG004]WOI56210.1 bifunctional DNA-formamidopyrimidine glycosylase/DNA-(apurinic or apyrimidinic site) lyase [Palleronia sp. LCG004]